ncbi:ribonuclease P protein subunit p25-like protein [Venturia canescens]|uniref:ribonuclease P protein subunit p25-like protein n=1 Tax=Venturia canescens TaxID=32260 RepID=UPI001C9CD02D|nr:ribonuclease P protein subunit p25-like protein [Venturia canescens]
MARSKLKKKKQIPRPMDEDRVDQTKIPIPNLPEKFLLMKVKSGTKIKNVLEYSLKEFASEGSVVWSGIGQGIGKVISCAEIFKRKISGLHQITKLRYVQSNNSKDGKKNENATIDRMVPEIHILLSNNVLDSKEPGYQAPGTCSMFQNSSVEGVSLEEECGGLKNARMSDVTAEEFASMGLRTGQKRPRASSQGHPTSKKCKKKFNDET